MSDENKKDEEVWVNPLLPDGKREYVVDLQITRVSEEDDTWTLKLSTDQIQQIHTALQHSVIENQREMSKLKKQAQRWSETGTDLEKLGVGKNRHLYKALKKENEKLAQLKDTLTDFMFKQKRML
ncbi:hypothetical protein [Tumebacillus permanentifrigoris]|uniref:Uncharacterized protein n=1 Tax=Tumebacillus permanentifrigoris TaxID=378543 RepID=A0A316DEG4_9BACL|nr:hypothetical protein [Tumebacillus permanentifrigoris]PWK15942.1 hypothetical protein C7459_102188 [Tumebacillus permanentifrigoris]